MTRRARNSKIESMKSELSNSEKRAMLNISAMIDSDDEIELDWDDIEECTDMPLDEAEELLQYMYELDILLILDFEDGIIG